MTFKRTNLKSDLGISRNLSTALTAWGFDSSFSPMRVLNRWVAEEFNIGNGRYGNSLERQWNRWVGVTKPPIAKQLVLAGRDKAPIEEGLKFSNDKMLSVRADSPAEAVALLYAVIDDLPKPVRDAWLANALVVSNADRAHGYPYWNETSRRTWVEYPWPEMKNPWSRRNPTGEFHGFTCH